MAASAGQLTTVMARGCDQEGRGFEPTNHDSRLRASSHPPWRASSQSEAAKSAIKTLRLEPAGMDLGDRDGHDEPSVGDWTSRRHLLGSRWWESDLERDYKVRLPGLVYVKEPAADREHGLTDLLDRIQLEARFAVRTFESPGELAEMMVEDLAASCPRDSPPLGRTPTCCRAAPNFHVWRSRRVDHPRGAARRSVCRCPRRLPPGSRRRHAES